jgi:hypothetical protein
MIAFLILFLHVLVSSFKTAEERDSYDLAERLGWSGEPGVLIEREMARTRL